MIQPRFRSLVRTVLKVVADVVRLTSLAACSHAHLAAENLFLRKQLALYLERQVGPRRADDATRITLIALSRLVAWRHLLTVVKPETLIRWHRKGFRLFWRLKSTPPGRPRVPAELRQLIADMALANHTWGEERIAAELLLKLGIRVSPRTIRQYLQRGGAPRAGARSQTWSTFVRNHARSVLACDFFATVTATFRVFHVFVVLEVGTRRIPAGFITSTDSNWRREAVRGTERNTCGAHGHRTRKTSTTTVVRYSPQGRSRTSRSLASTTSRTRLSHPEQISARLRRIRRTHNRNVLAPALISC